MRCHEILGIKETASNLEIERAYSQKYQRLLANQALLEPNAYEKKRWELENARLECENWKSKPSIEKAQHRVNELPVVSQKRDVRMMSVCFGPFTCVDTKCSIYDSESCCEGMYGTQQCPVICDVIFWAPVAIPAIYVCFKSLLGISTDISVKRSRAKFEKVGKMIDAQNAKLQECVQKRDMLVQRLESERAILNTYKVFMEFFSHIGSDDGSSLIDEQSNKVADLSLQIQESEVSERKLRVEIEKLRRMRR